MEITSQCPSSQHITLQKRNNTWIFAFCLLQLCQFISHFSLGLVMLVCSSLSVCCSSYPFSLLPPHPFLFCLFFSQTPGGSIIHWQLPLLSQKCQFTTASYPWFIYSASNLGFSGIRLRWVNSLACKWVRCLSFLSTECLAVYGSCCQ